MIPLSRRANPGGPRDVQSIISDYFVDQDPRVRTAALKAMVRQSLCNNPTSYWWFGALRKQIFIHS